MAPSARSPLTPLWFLAAFLAAGLAQGGPADELLPPPIRKAEKRSLGGDDERIRRYDGRGVFGAAFSADGKLLLAPHANQGMAIWDANKGHVLGALQLYASHDAGISAGFTPDGKKLVVSSSGGHQEVYPVAVWDVEKRQMLRTLDEGVNDSPIAALAVAPNGKTIALAGGMGRRGGGANVLFWDLATGDETARLEGLVSAEALQRRGGRAFQALAYSPDGRTLAALLEGRIVLVETAMNKVRGELVFTPLREVQSVYYTGGLGSLAFSPDGRTLAAGCNDGAIRRFDLRTAREFTPLPGHNGAVVALVWSPDGKRIHSYGQDGQLIAWRAADGRDWQPKSNPLSDAALESLWEVLRGDDPLDLFGSMETLAAAPGPAVQLLRKRVTPVPKAEEERITRLVEDLQKGDYNARKRAVVELRKIGAAAAPALRKSQERGGYDELLRRLMYEFDSMAPPPDQVRAVRMLRVLERIGTAEARKLLEELAGGSPEAALTGQARAALDRLGKAEAPKAEPAPEKLWDVLADDDSAMAYRAIRVLAGRPSAAASVRDRLKEVLGKDTFNDDPQRVAKLIDDLDSKVFAVRDKASKALRNLGQLSVPAMRKAVEAAADLETKRRLEQLLAEAGKVVPPPEMLRIGRVLEVLELMSAPEGRQTLEALAKDVQIKWLSEAVGESLRRQREGKR